MIHFYSKIYVTTVLFTEYLTFASQNKKLSHVEYGNYDLLRQKAVDTDWNSLRPDNINNYAQNITDQILTLAESCIPNKTITIRPSGPPWITTAIKRYIRKRKRAYRTARLTNEDRHWTTFRQLRNTVTAMIRDAKKSYKQSLSDKLKSDILSSKSVLKAFLSQNNSSSIPPLEKDGIVYSDETDKVNLLNDQTLINDIYEYAVLPDILPYTVQIPLQSIVLSPDEVKKFLNRSRSVRLLVQAVSATVFLKNFLPNYHFHSLLSSTTLLILEKFQISSKWLMWRLFLKVVSYLLSQIIDTFHY